MKWDAMTSKVTLTPRDFTVLQQCKTGIDEVLRQPKSNHNIPPLWSLLSYEMLFDHGVSVREFWQGYRGLKDLARDRDSHYWPISIKKNTKGVRRLAIPDYYLSCHQAFIMHYVLEALPVDAHAYAYRKGYSIRDCAVPHVGQQTLIHMDIKDFFSSVKEETVFECLLEATGYAPQLVNFISRICCCKDSLPQGASTSPILSNICFRECDEAIARYAERNGMVYTRYSDDLYLSGTITDPAAVIRQVTTMLKRRGYRVNRDKTRVLHQNNPQRVVGLAVNEKLQVTRAYRRQLRKEVYYVIKYGKRAEDAMLSESYLSYLLSLQGKIAYVLSIDPENKEFLTAKREIARLVKECDEEYRKIYPF